MAEHEQIVNLTGPLRLAAAAGDGEAMRAALEHVVAHLHPHTVAEETGLFAVLRRDPGFTDHIDRLCSEHAALDDLARRIRAGDLGLVDRFIHELREHIDKEENGLFPAAAIGLDGPDWEQIDALTPPPGAHT
jgi:hemerythrin-like domain-containing protein